MKPKESIKDLVARVVRKGKTKGRPSKYELTMSKVMSHLLEQNREVISDVMVETAIGGTGILRIKYKGNKIKMEKLTGLNKGE